MTEMEGEGDVAVDISGEREADGFLAEIKVEM